MEGIDLDKLNSIHLWLSQTDGSRKRAIAVSSGGLPMEVEKVDQTTPWNDFYFVQANGAPTTLSIDSEVGDRTITVSSVANISIGDWIGLSPGGTSEDERYFWTHVTNVVGNVVTLGTLIDYPFLQGSTVLSTTREMNVNGSSTEQVFSIRAGGSGGTLAIHITRIMMACLTATAVDLSKFGDITGGLSRGMYLRVKENGVYRNKGIFRTNYDLAKFAYDWTPFSAANPIQGQDGFAWRFSLNGDDKHGAVSRVEGGNIGALEWVIQDDLRTLDNIESLGANHEVD